MLLPVLGWAATGAIFFIKPGYGGAYEALPVKTYPIERPLAIAATEGWLELRYLRTVLGEHVLARSSQGWLHLDAGGVGSRPAPGSLRRSLHCVRVLALVARNGGGGNIAHRAECPSKIFPM